MQTFFMTQPIKIKIEGVDKNTISVSFLFPFFLHFFNKFNFFSQLKSSRIIFSVENILHMYVNDYLNLLFLICKPLKENCLLFFT